MFKIDLLQKPSEWNMYLRDFYRLFCPNIVQQTSCPYDHIGDTALPHCSFTCSLHAYVRMCICISMCIYEFACGRA